MGPRPASQRSPHSVGGPLAGWTGPQAYSTPFASNGQKLVRNERPRPHELPPTRLVIHRQTSAHERRKWTRSVQSRSGILAYLCTRQHWLWITVELHISGACHEEAVARERGRYAPVRRVLGSEPLSLRTHRHRGRSRPLKNAVVEYQAPSVAV